MKINFFLLFFSSILLFGQTKRFYYTVDFKLDSINTISDEVVLDINDEYNYFYSNKYLLIDSLNKKSSKFQFAYPKFDKIVKWIKKGNVFEFTHRLSYNFYKYKSEISLNWNLEKDLKNIGGYSVQKATTSYGGRNWTAWFTLDIPLPYGPYVFNGLPGMVLEVYDSANDYHFRFYKNVNLLKEINSEKVLEKYLGVNQFNIEKSHWNRILLNYYNNPIPEYIRGDAKMLKNDGREYTIRDYKDLEKRIRASIRKKNNPIELNERIDYKP